MTSFWETLFRKWRHAKMASGLHSVAWFSDVQGPKERSEGDAIDLGHLRVRLTQLGVWLKNIFISSLYTEAAIYRRVSYRGTVLESDIAFIF